MSESGSYPIVGFHFMVKFAGMEESVDMGFQEVSGLETTIETEEFREGGNHAFVYHLPVKIKYTKLVLKRGLLTNSKLTKWVRDAVENFDIKPLQVTVSLLDETHTALMTWQVHQAWPVKWSVTGLNAQSNEVVVETLELAYANLRLKMKR